MRESGLRNAVQRMADLYSHFAAHALYKIDESQVTKTQRQVGKVVHLGLGFGAGGATFQKVAKLMGGVDMSLDEATKVVEAYRSAHAEIATGWRTFQNKLTNIKQGIETTIDPWGMCVTEQNAVRLPSGRRIYYPDLKQERDASDRNLKSHQAMQQQILWQYQKQQDSFLCMKQE
jgi:DNA polymerase I-like protein with 3'-5' exonuclease and polymerase domains